MYKFYQTGPRGLETLPAPGKLPTLPIATPLTLLHSGGDPLDKKQSENKHLL